MQTGSLKVELVGLLPAAYRLCTKCQPVDYLSLEGADYVFQQLTDYPPEVLQEQERLYELYHNLAHDFSGAVKLIAVNLLSPRGLWLSLRHKLGKKGAVVIGSKRVLHADCSYETIRQAIDHELAQLNVPGVNER